jgi:hypothetical protein
MTLTGEGLLEMHQGKLRTALPHKPILSIPSPGAFALLGD